MRYTPAERSASGRSGGAGRGGGGGGRGEVEAGENLAVKYLQCLGMCFIFFCANELYLRMCVECRMCSLECI